MHTRLHACMHACMRARALHASNPPSGAPSSTVGEEDFLSAPPFASGSLAWPSNLLLVHPIFPLWASGYRRRAMREVLLLLLQPASRGRTQQHISVPRVISKCSTQKAQTNSWNTTRFVSRARA